MANRTLTSNDWSATADWGGTVPVDADNALVAPGSFNVDAGLTQTGVELARLYVPPLYRGLVGTSGSPLQINADLLEFYGSGGLFYQARDDNTTGETTDDVIIQAANSGVPVELDTYPTVNDSTYTNIRLMRGKVTLKADMVFNAAAEVEVGYVQSQATDVRCDIVTSATVPNLNVGGGVVNCASAVTTAIVAGGTLVQDLAVITLLKILPGGVCEYKHTAATTIVVYSGGLLDLTKKVGYQTITTLVLFSGAKVRGLSDQVTVTNAKYYDRAA